MPRLTPGRRAGFSLAEIMVAVVLLGIVVGTILRVIARQQRFYHSANEVIDTRSQIRQAASILPTDLRGLSSIGGDIKSLSDSSVEFLANIGSSVICNIPNLQQFDLPPANLSRHTLTSWYSQPQVGDSMFIFDDGVSFGSLDDTWARFAIADIGTNTTTCAGLPFADPVNDPPATKPRWRVRVTAGTLPTSVTVGSVVRFARPVRYSLYQAPDNNWYLGFREYVAGAWTTRQPVSGPYRAYVSGGNSGLTFAYYDSLGTAITTVANAARISRVDVRVRAAGQAAKNAIASSGGQFSDSLMVRVAIRNRQ